MPIAATVLCAVNEWNFGSVPDGCSRLTSEAGCAAGATLYVADELCFRILVMVQFEITSVVVLAVWFRLSTDPKRKAVHIHIDRRPCGFVRLRTGSNTRKPWRRALSPPRRRLRASWLSRAKQSNNFFESPDMIVDVCFHCWRHAQRLMNPAEIVVHVMKGDGVLQIFKLFGKRIREARKPAHRHSHRQILALNVARRNVAAGFFVGIPVDCSTMRVAIWFMSGSGLLERLRMSSIMPREL